MLKACKVAFIGVLLAVFPADKSVLWADEARTNSQQTVTSTAAPQSATYTGKVVVVDREANTLTVEIDKRICLFKISPDTTIVSAGKKISLKDLSSGQPVTLDLVQGSRGEVLVASATVNSSSNETEAAGDSPKRKKRK